MTTEDSCELYIRLFEELSFERLDNMESFISADIKFKDPFNDFSGIDSFRRMLVKILCDVRRLKFNVTHRAWSDNVLFLRWSFQGDIRGVANWKVQGVSEIIFDDCGMVCQHIDHWDAAEQFYEKLPLIGTILRFIRNRIRVS